jgi:cytochrome c-type biogenesis protein CcmH
MLPVVAGVLYTMLGNPAAVNPNSVPVARNPHGEGSADDPKIVAMIETLAEKMKANPDDPNGWVLLGRSYLKLGRYDDSAAAFAEAAKRMPGVAALLADQAEAISMAQGKSLAGRPSELLKRALALGPNDPKTVAMSGAAAAERKDFDGAIKLYTHLKSLVQPGSEDAQQIDQAIAELGAMKNGKAAPSVAAASAATPVPAAPAAAAAAPSGAAGGNVSGRVEIDPKLGAKMAPGDKLFIYARNAEGSRMPLAILQASAGDLPKTFTLTDAMAMTPAQTISMAKSVVVEARVSKSGNAMAQSGDLRGSSAPLSPGATNVRIVIDQVVP